MNEEITVAYSITTDVLMPAFKWHHHSLVRSRKIVGVIASVMCVLSLLASLSPSPELPIKASFAVAPATVVLLIVLMGWLGKSHYAKAIQKSRSYGKQIIFKISADGLLVNAPDSSSQHSWSFFNRSLLTPDGVLLYPQNRWFNWLPKSAFTSEADYNRFLELIADKTNHSKLG